MKPVLYLFFIALLALAGCQRHKMNAKNLTIANVKRDLPPATFVEADSLTKSPGQQPVPAIKESLAASTKTVNPDTTVARGKEEPEEKTVKRTTRVYHIIASSHPRENLAQEAVAQLKAEGYDDAQVIVKDERYRVSVANNANKQEVLRKRDELALRMKQDDLWIILY